tara:strand:+ start:5542 stop:5772 length:231 start_codon:yes stop_codon:yes gene_type:complete
MDIRITNHQFEEIREICVSRGQMRIFSEICTLIGREDEDDYIDISGDESEDYDEADMEEEDIIFGSIGDSRFYYLE